MEGELNGVETPFGKRYIALGMFLAPLKRFRSKFGKSQLKIYLNEDLSKNPYQMYADICRYLEISADFKPDMSRRYNSYGAARSGFLTRQLNRVAGSGPFRKLPIRLGKSSPAKPKMSQEDRDFLIEVFREEVEALSSFLDRDLKHWLA